ncbi:MAG: class II fructose-bisphosphate aldolase [Patescibacteria group bacterium]|nr:class II fructose-bisphosphate aldolase [Patescibacteria group bacterium]
MKSLREYINEAESTKTAIGHFNISNSEGFWAVVGASKKLNLPVIIGVSEGERDFIGIKQVAALVATVKAEGLPIFLNADHTYSVDRVKEVVDAGFDAVIIDGAEKSFEENLVMTKASVNYKNSINENILIEAEYGFIGKSSKVLDELPEGVEISESTMTKPIEAAEFVKESGIDLFAPAVGNIHGMVKGGNPKIDIERIRLIRDAAGVPLVLHGGSGITDEEFKRAIEAGISIIHINTEIRLAYKQGIQKSLIENPDEIAPYKYLKPAVQAMQAVVEKRMALFANL